MKRRNFIKTAGALSIVPAVNRASSFEMTHTVSGTKEIYEWRIYTLTGEGDLLDDFFKEILLPAYGRKQIKAGAFRPYKPKEGEKEQRHLLFVYPDMDTYLRMKKTLWDDPLFRRESEAFYNRTAPAPVYSNFEAYLSEAFDKIPVHRTPDADRTLFELRIYHSPNEEANQRKITMFNREEIDLFDQVAIHSVLYGEILAGSRMPALLYLTWYRDEEARNAAWKTFVNHPEWKRMSVLPAYAHTATNNQSIFLTPMLYSQL
jgi:hypothetical protein